MSSEHAEYLSHLLGSLPFAEPVMSDNSEDGTSIQVICRVAKGAEQHWAEVVEKILKKAEAERFKAHVCRLYFLKNGAIVYGWHVGITSGTMGYSIEKVYEAIYGPKRPAVKTKPRSKTQNGSNVMSNYNPPLQADDKGNPLGKTTVEEMTFTGMEGRTDRNMPSSPAEDGRGGGRGVKKIS